jgi:hypothetical protein
VLSRSRKKTLQERFVLYSEARYLYAMSLASTNDAMFSGNSHMPVGSIDSREPVLRETCHGVREQRIACCGMEYTDVHGDHCERSCHKIAGKTPASHVVTGASTALITLHFRGRPLMVFRGFALRITELMLAVYEKYGEKYWSSASRPFIGLTVARAFSPSITLDKPGPRRRHMMI